jgi:hypothetical protein
MGCICSKTPTNEEPYVYDTETQQYHTPYDLPSMKKHQTIVSQSYFKQFVKQYQTEQDAYTQIVT